MEVEFHLLTCPLTSLTYGNISVMGVMKESEGKLRRLEFHTISLPSPTSLMYGDIS
ncbi:hypothetical protein J6590_105611, partial [Homalodisca vitripennis]